LQLIGCASSKPMATTLQDLIKNNKDVLTVLGQSLARLKELRSQGPPPGALNRILAQINTTQAALSTAEIIHVHLRAASTVVQAIPPAEEEQLNELARSLDKTILANTIAGAAFSFVQAAVAEAEEVQEITLRHT
jgi:hypothetical protein